MTGATIPFTVNSDVCPCNNSPSNDEVHVKLIMSSSKSQDLDALNKTSLCEGNTFWSSGESHMMNGAWFSSGRWHQTTLSCEREVLVELVTPS